MDLPQGAAPELAPSQGVPRSSRSPKPTPRDRSASVEAIGQLPIPALLVLPRAERAGREQEIVFSHGILSFAAALVGGEDVLVELALDAAASGRSTSRELSGLRTDLCTIRAIPRPFEGGGVLVQFVDDTELAEQVRRNRMGESLLERLVETLPVPLAAKDPRDGMRFTVVNRCFEETFGLRREDIIGRSDADFFSPERVERYQRDDAEVLRGDSAVVIDETIETVLGVRDARTIKVPIRDADGRPELLLVMVQDVTDVRRSAKGPSAVAGAATPRIVLEGAFERVTSEAREADARVELEISGDLLGDDAHGPTIPDAPRLVEALAHLLRNAIAYSPRHSSIQLRAVPTPNGEGVRFEVRDEGIGIPTEQQAALRRLVEAPGSSTGAAPLAEGIGLGLSLCRRLAGSIGAALSFESDLGEGSVFRIDAPAAGFRPAPLSEAASKRGRGAFEAVRGSAAATARAVQRAARPRPARVLVADDNVVQQRITARHLERLGHTVTLASCGLQALQMLEERRDRFDLLVVDARLGGAEEDGLRVVRRLRELEAFERRAPEDGLPTIVVGAGDFDVDPEERDRLHGASLTAGASAWIEKPFRPDQLAAEFGRIDRRR